MYEIAYFIIIIFIFIIITIYPNYLESFDITFGSPRNSNEADKSSIKHLLEIGSQGDANKKYDVVSKDILGPIHRQIPEEDPPEPEDPNCFANPYNFDYNSLKNYSMENNTSCNNSNSCCDKPSQYQIDMDWDLLSESLEYDFNLDLAEGSNLDLPECCSSK